MTLSRVEEQALRSCSTAPEVGALRLAERLARRLAQTATDLAQVLDRLCRAHAPAEAVMRTEVLQAIADQREESVESLMARIEQQRRENGDGAGPPRSAGPPRTPND